MKIRYADEPETGEKAQEQQGGGLKFYNPCVLLSYLFYLRPLAGLYYYILRKDAQANIEAATQEGRQ